MRRLNWLLAVLATLGAWPGVANPSVQKLLFAKPIGGCKVQVKVERLRGLAGSDAVVRARTRFAFKNNQCTHEVGELKPAKARRAKGHYDSFTFVDEVCANGTWHYRFQSRDGTRDELDFELAPSHTVEVKGCGRKACPERLEAPARISEGEPRPPPCKVAVTMGYLQMGQMHDQLEPMGEILEGKDILELTDREGRVTVRGKTPGKAWVALPRPTDRGNCAEFTVTPHPYKQLPLDLKKQWAYRAFAPRHVSEDVEVPLSKGQRWTLPVSGKARLVPYDTLVRLDVDDQCRPALYAPGVGNGPRYTGVMVTDRRGEDHLYFVTLQPEPPGRQ
jgi:hypothetical protein